MVDKQTGAPLTFEPFAEDSETGLEIVDSIDRHRYRLRTPASVTPSPTDTDQFLFPVDAAVTVRTAALMLPNIVLTHVRDTSGKVITSTEQFSNEEFSNGVYTIELHTPIKLYLRVESPLTVQANFERTSIEFGDVTTVAVGARSYHQQPAGTVTTTSDPEDVMAAVSTFGSALKTTSPERSYPTLRGHPPTVELSDTLFIPNGLSPPDTDLTIELPPELKFIYPSAPLAYYLGAELVPGEKPRLRAGTDFEHALDSEHGFENEVERVLKQTFFLDCITRSEGFYDTELHERRMIETDPEFDADLDFASIYGASSADRLAAYLDIPFDIIESHLPDWKLMAHIQPLPTGVETLPFVTRDLPIIRTVASDDLARVSPMEASAFDVIVPSSADGGVTHSASHSAGSQLSENSHIPDSDQFYVKVPSAESHEHAWIGGGAPVNASKVLVSAYQNRLGRTVNDGDIRVTVVCNDAEMGDEQTAVNEIYEEDTTLPFDVSVRSELTQADLRNLLATPMEFLHYIGHIDSDGFACTDGKLDATELDSVNVDAFLLNTCHSYEQGLTLIEKGAIGGIVTYNDLFDFGAVQMGCTLARLLNAGFPLYSALEIARNESMAGEQYLVIGDGGLAIEQSEGGSPALCEIERTTDAFRIVCYSYSTEEKGMGCATSPNLPSLNEYYLTSTRSPTAEVSQEELAEFLSLEDIPLRINGTLHWSSQIDLKDF